MAYVQVMEKVKESAVKLICLIESRVGDMYGQYLFQICLLFHYQMHWLPMNLLIAPLNNNEWPYTQKMRQWHKMQNLWFLDQFHFRCNYTIFRLLFHNG